ncbi:thioredoxin domain-containing protein [Robiginitalea sp. M366]|uniref:thioredoxin domain-containing protein n=1 Tax=Robiginitalea aestuariiviva TaxID=3036903 RepID=UPI00240DF024|nr:thioredoxin domain-containing protein [Robiginitalea aestuariiviva]MDG1570986.1 thioredoxin domain-containing protein [Robiginitalea aestuariiviva]
MEPHTPNALIRESSPYLLQHAYNPVQWLPWNEETLAKARAENKPLLISIGYAACHWCHVMERECFEENEVAEVMNAHFIPVKVDREERPDVDQIYMDALQIMTGSGGWPLNVVALPDGRPFWGATYLPREQWISALVQLHRLFRDQPEKVVGYAADLTDAVHKINVPLPDPGAQLPNTDVLAQWIEGWKGRFDPEYGGSRGAPKFMMPVTLRCLLHWDHLHPDPAVEAHLRRSLTRMARGGLYDQLGGGFSRYSVDARWHVPHFEKMLYDNAQLMTLYSEAYARYGDPYYREVVAGTLEFVQASLKAPEGGYYASLDADSEDPEGRLTEGAFYRWRLDELQEVLGGDYALFERVFHLGAEGHWEDGYYVLMRTGADAESLGMDSDVFQTWLERCRKVLLARREERPAPRLDHKVLLSWNGLLLSGLCDTWRYGQLEGARTAALELGTFLSGQMDTEGRLPHGVSEGHPKGNGFLEDYAAVAEGFIRLFGITGNPHWMERARNLAAYVETHFSESGQALFYFNSGQDAPLIRRTLEVADNVIPASNSIMAENLFVLGHFYGNAGQIRRAAEMLAAIGPSMERYSGQHANWLRLALKREAPFRELAICGPEALGWVAEIGLQYLPQVFLAGCEEASDLPLFRERYRPGKTRAYLCQGGACQQPETTLEGAIQAVS